MKVLQLASYYTVSSVFKSLFSEINKNSNVKQKVFVPIRNESENSKNSVENLEIQYTKCLNISDRLFFKKKIWKIHKILEKKLLLNEIDIVHAHTLFSDGAVAYKIYKQRHIPYVITVRNTDLNIYLRYLKWLHPLAKKIIKNSKMVIFTNHNYYYKLKNLFKEINFNYEIIPNGLDKFWFQNQNSIKELNQENSLTFLYVGNFSKNKNIDQIILYLENLLQDTKLLNITLILVGGVNLVEIIIRAI